MDDGQQRVVDERAIYLFGGVAGLRDSGLTGAGVTVGVVDADVAAPDLAEHVVARSTAVSPPADSRQHGHGDTMARAIVHTAPGCGLAVANAEDVIGDILRSTIQAAVDDLVSGDLARLINISLQVRRTPTVCSDERRCVACRAVEAAGTDLDLIVIAAAGNRGLDGITCPGASPGAIPVGSTVGPSGSSAPNGPVEPVSGTSISAAMVCGACALLSEAFPGLGAAELRGALAATATRVPNVPPEAAGHGSAHYYRAYRYIEHCRAGRTPDEDLAQQIINRPTAAAGLDRNWEHQLEALSADGPERAELNAGVEHALELAPWSAGLNYFKAALTAGVQPLAALGPVLEAVRLDWNLAGPHRLQGRILELVGAERDAAIEVQIAELLEADRQLEAADLRLGSM